MRGAAKTRKYDVSGRALQAEERREAVVEAATAQFFDRDYEEVTLQSVAEAAGVALKTVVRQFGTKEALFLECLKRRRVAEAAVRRVDPGDIAGAVQVLAERYEALGDSTIRFLRVEERFATVAEMMMVARRFHFEWLGQVFAPWMPKRDPAEKRRRLAQLFTATELYSWWVLRHRFELDRKTCEKAMFRSLEALVSSFSNDARE